MATSDLRLAAKPALSSAELEDAGALVREAKWNQIEADWRIFLELGRVYAAYTDAGRIVATTATLPFGGRFAWISMVLVAGDYRRRGLATRLMRRAMDDLAAAGLVPVLDATPDGRAVYRALGFEDSWGFHRLVLREPQRASETAPAPDAVVIRPIADADWPALCAYDATAFGADRGAVLARLRGRLPAAELCARAAGPRARRARSPGVRRPCGCQGRGARLARSPRLFGGAAAHAHAVREIATLRRRGAHLRRDRAGVRVSSVPRGDYVPGTDQRPYHSTCASRQLLTNIKGAETKSSINRLGKRSGATGSRSFVKDIG